MEQNEPFPQDFRTLDTSPAQFHLPDFTGPDFTRPELERVDLAESGFTMPDTARAIQLPLWPEDMARVDDGRPDPALPDLLEPDRPDVLGYPGTSEHVMPEPEYAPEVVMQRRPGELDPAALSMALNSPDRAGLPSGLTYPQLYAHDDEMTRRKRHFGLLEFGLEQDARDAQ